MAKAHSELIPVQSYLARKPAKVNLATVRSGQELPGSWRINKDGHAIFGELGKEVVEVLSRPDQLVQDFANTSASPEDILRFTRRYGVLHRDDEDWVTTPDGEWVSHDNFCIHCDQWLQSQARVRQEWERKNRTDDSTAEEIAREINPKTQIGHAVKAVVRPSKRGFHLELRPDDLLGAIWLAFIGVSERARKCQNVTCQSPFFLASRRDQKFCNENCSRLAANRRWWKRKGPQWRAGRKANQSQLGTKGRSAGKSHN